MAEHQYYSEEVLIEKMERGEYGWLDYVNHFSPEWQEEYARYCKEHSLMAGNESAAFLTTDYGDTKEYQPPNDGPATRNAGHIEA